MPLEAGRAIDVRTFLGELCGVHALAFDVDGDARITVADNTLDTVFDNILKNYADLALRENISALRLRIGVHEQGGMAEITIDAPGLPGVPELQRLFEPFWSSDPGGLGIGLYQAKQVLELKGGTLSVSKPADAPLRFHVHCPVLMSH